MSLEAIASQLLTLAGTFKFEILAAIFIICLIGEAKVSVPFLLEAIWLSVGFQLDKGVLSPFQVIAIWLASQLGKQAGAVILFLLGRAGFTGLGKLWKKLHLPSLSKKFSFGKSKNFSRLSLKKVIDLDQLSPFTAALGRMVGLRVPIALALSAKRKLRVLLLGVLIQSIAWDSTYIALGAIFHKTAEKPLFLLLYATLTFIAMYCINLTLQFLLVRFGIKSRQKAPVGPVED